MNKVFSFQKKEKQFFISKEILFEKKLFFFFYEVSIFFKLI